MQNVESEKEVLGCILVKPALLDDELSNIEPNYFSDLKYKKVFNKILEMYKSNQPIDIVTVSTSMKEDGTLKDVGGRAFINDLAENIISIITVGFHANIIEKNYKLRQIYNETYNASKKAEQGANPDELVGDLIDSLYNITTQEKEEDKYIINQNPNFISNNTEVEDTEVFYTPYSNVNTILGPIRRGNLIILGAYPGIGKSIMCGEFALAAEEQKFPVHIFSIEMTTYEYLERLMINKSEIDTSKFEHKLFSQTELNQIQKLENEFFANFDCTIFNRAGIDTDYVRKKLQAEKKRKGQLGLVIIDYLQLMKGKGQFRNQQVAQISNTLKVIAKDLDCFIIAISSLKRNVYTDTKTGEEKLVRPTLFDFKESGDIEYDADKAILLHRTNINDTYTEVIIAKNRRGSTGSTYLNFVGKYAKFEEMKQRSL